MDDYFIYYHKLQWVPRMNRDTWKWRESLAQSYFFDRKEKTLFFSLFFFEKETS
jgi:hypothetical protein